MQRMLERLFKRKWLERWISCEYISPFSSSAEAERQELTIVFSKILIIRSTGGLLGMYVRLSMLSVGISGELSGIMKVRQS